MPTSLTLVTKGLAERVLSEYVRILVNEEPEGVEWNKEQRVDAMRRALSHAVKAGAVKVGEVVKGAAYITEEPYR